MRAMHFRPIWVDITRSQEAQKRDRHLPEVLWQRTTSRDKESKWCQAVGLSDNSDKPIKSNS